MRGRGPVTPPVRSTIGPAVDADGDEDGGTREGHRSDVLDERRDWPVEHAGHGIEVLPHQRPLTDEQQAARRRVDRRGVGVEHEARVAPGARHVDTPNRGRTSRVVQEVAAVGQQARELVPEASGRRRLGSGLPPDSGTLKIAENVFGVNRIRPSARHAPPRNNGALASVRTPPSRSTRFSQPSAPNPIERLSGDQNGNTAFSVPASGWTEISCRGSAATAAAARRCSRRIRAFRPSGEIASEALIAAGGRG